MNERLRKLVYEELDERPDYCPWCGQRSMFAKHAARKHPDKYDEWKENHTKITQQITYYVKDE
jgi:ribosomal protein S27AE